MGWKLLVRGWRVSEINAVGTGKRNAWIKRGRGECLDVGWGWYKSCPRVGNSTTSDILTI